ncbi:MAG TPA: UDP-N-acetylglucosamine 2-epimerase (non-hydrolyzing) [Saprospiraceae bacterium]|nr:UDP-N-acetylglucosamine 2-epimerase (non-hydrolyzing) [Saprospiraceae bacterium]HNA42843.1 UDP-N-acetylglucosamine 2-epimerase (non-hydrolyzing) [Saprospiraceae bacterium]
MDKTKIAVVIGARPQFIKHAALEHELRKSFNVITIHTGQHYDENMSQVFFDQLGMARPDYILNIGSAGHGVQTAKMMIEIEDILLKERPAYLLVYGDTNSTLAGALVAAKLQVKVIHVEAGLRSYNREMPEEINRVLCDHVSDLLFCPTHAAADNLKAEGITKNVYVVGDIMTDMQQIALDRKMVSKTAEAESYYFATIHRPYNTDHKDRLLTIIETFQKLDKPVRFSVHPRTMHKLNEWHCDLKLYKNVTFLEPLSYFDSLNMQYNAAAVITDSGGMQKEAYFFRKKCVTIRKETEWTETLVGNWNTLVFDNLDELQIALRLVPTNYVEDLYGNGNTAVKIVETVSGYK